MANELKRERPFCAEPPPKKTSHSNYGTTQWYPADETSRVISRLPRYPGYPVCRTRVPCKIIRVPGYPGTHGAILEQVVGSVSSRGPTRKSSITEGGKNPSIM
eukprot:2115690-Rhodomonas_salina.2